MYLNFAYPLRKLFPHRYTQKLQNTPIPMLMAENRHSGKPLPYYKDILFLETEHSNVPVNGHGHFYIYHCCVHRTSLIFAHDDVACVFFDLGKMFIRGVGKVGEWKGCTP